MKRFLPCLLLLLTSCSGRGNTETYALLAESVLRTYLSSEVVLLDDDELLAREKEMRTVIVITGRFDNLADDYHTQLLDQIQERELTPLPLSIPKPIGLRPPAPPHPDEATDVACHDKPNSDLLAELQR